MCQTRPLLFVIVPFHNSQINIAQILTINDKSTCLCLEPKVAVWKSQTHTLSYGGTPSRAAFVKTVLTLQQSIDVDFSFNLQFVISPCLRCQDGDVDDGSFHQMFFEARNEKCQNLKSTKQSCLSVKCFLIKGAFNLRLFTTPHPVNRAITTAI